MKKIFRKRFIVIMIIVFIILLGMKKSEAEAEEVSTVPSNFDLRDKISIKVEDQGTRGTCWTFASLNTLETYLSLNGYGDYDFSEMHIECIENGFNDLLTDEWNSEIIGQDDGGDFDRFIDYFSTKQGPVLESEVPYYKNNIYGERYTNDDLEILKNTIISAYVYDYQKYYLSEYEGNK